MKLFLLLITIFLSSSFADKTIIKTITINQMSYPEKTLSQIKEIALQKVKLAAAKEMYGEFLLSETLMVSGKILDDVVSEKSGGIIHIKGEPKFKNGENFADLEVTIEAYATDDEIRDMTSQFIKLNSSKYTNTDISSQKDKDEDSDRDFLNSYQEQIQETQRGFYGLWSGFIIRSNGGSGDVNIEITDSGLSRVNYNSLKCGGELIIQEKTADLVKFKEKLTYGEDKCIDKHFISLKKINSIQLLYMQFDEHDKEVARGTLYREE